MASRFTSAAVEGQREAIAAFKRLPDVSRERLGDATDKATFRILNRMRANVPVRFGFLRRALDRSYSRTTGIGNVGIAKGASFPIPGGKGATAMPRKYAHLQEFGSRHQAPRPFAIPAAEAEKGPYLDDCRRAGKLIEADMAVTTGGGLL